MNRKTLVTAAVAGALGLVAVAAPAVASAFGASDRESTSMIVPGGVVTDVVTSDEPLFDRSTAIRTAVPVQPAASAVPVPPPATREPAEEDVEFEAHNAPTPVAPTPVAPPVIAPVEDDHPGGNGRGRDDRDRDDDGPTRVNPEPHRPPDDAGFVPDDQRRDDDRGHHADDRKNHDHRHGDDDDRRDDDGRSR
ncbi:hypothetical protein [Microbacterium sp. NPDC056234]|uniref:hypothetical protein n=1 Tax=Microbacterium sp. NPDC056234 TaxID=3345757 RepID=UPI0035E285E2